MKVLQINTTVNTGSTGRIAEDIGSLLISQGVESYIAYGRGDRPSKSKLIKIGSQRDVIAHGLYTTLFDRHAFGSRSATLDLVSKIEAIDPDVIALHNLHGYYLNIEVLFNYLSYSQKPIVWTLYDCWSFTGHCTYFDDISCERWITGCYSCPKKRRYPASYLLDNSKTNYSKKMELFNSVENLTFVVPSHWLRGLVRNSFLRRYPVEVITTGVNLDTFRPIPNDLKERLGITNGKMILGCANIWDERKGLKEFISLHNLVKDFATIVLVGLNSQQVSSLPKGMVGIRRTESIEELARYYSAADVFVNPTFQDNFPTTNIEALACGTPVVTYETGGSPESVDESTGQVVPKGDIEALGSAVMKICQLGKERFVMACRSRAIQRFDRNDRYSDYLKLFRKSLDATHE